MAEKGASLIVRDFKNELIGVISKYNMPAIIKHLVVEEIDNNLIKVAEYETAKEEQEYKKKLEQEEKEKNNKEEGEDKNAKTNK